ncbi:MAG TPA: hypothetical protein VKP64_03145 [Mycobacteriales bacterium]|nr:hypothetical protein [Mycobacteriales bacterium]
MHKATIAIQGVGTIPLEAIAASGSYSFGTVAAGGSLERTVTLALPQDAGNEVSDASVTVPFTLTATATQ